jgi:nicotinamide riboside transporter PnuC
LQILTWVLTALSILGAYLNSRQDVRGFYLWLPANLTWGVVAIMNGLPAQAVLWFYYAGVCVYGISMWERKEVSDESKSKNRFNTNL